MKARRKNIVVIGCNSAIARAVMIHYAQEQSTFFLVGRNEANMQATTSGVVEAGGIVAGVYLADLRQRDQHDDVVRRSVDALGTIDLVFIAHGTLPDQRQLNADVDATLDSFITNALSPISFAHRYFTVLANQGHGMIAALSSVAGDRGRKTNHAYGSAKAALTAFLSGLRGLGREHGVHVLTIKPGPVRTPMTKGRKMPFMVEPSIVAHDIVKAIESRRYVIYSPWIWRLILACYRLLPEWLATRMRF